MRGIVRVAAAEYKRWLWNPRSLMLVMLIIYARDAVGKVLCDHAMCGDRGIAESFGCELELPATIANGDDVCQIRFVRKNK